MNWRERRRRRRDDRLAGELAAKILAAVGEEGVRDAQQAIAQYGMAGDEWAEQMRANLMRLHEADRT